MAGATIAGTNAATATEAWEHHNHQLIMHEACVRQMARQNDLVMGGCATDRTTLPAACIRTNVQALAAQISLLCRQLQFTQGSVGTANTDTPHTGNTELASPTIVGTRDTLARRRARHGMAVLHSAPVRSYLLNESAVRCRRATAKSLYQHETEH